MWGLVEGRETEEDFLKEKTDELGLDVSGNHFGDSEILFTGKYGGVAMNEKVLESDGGYNPDSAIVLTHVKCLVISLCNWSIKGPLLTTSILNSKTLR